MNERDTRLESLGYPLDDAPKAAGLYTPLVVTGKTAYLSGMVPFEAGALKYSGKVPSQVPVDRATDAAALCAANLLRVIRRDLGSLERIGKLVKLTGFVNSDSSFTEQHVVMNGASKLFLDVLGDAGAHARSAVGMANLPLGAAVEVELIFEVADR
jgi:enamine deaminase RidA (YjgF/YER057c/UK114 family)